MNDYRYFEKNKKIFRCRCEVDPDPQSPIGEDYMLSTILLWWGRYGLGNENEYESPGDFLVSIAGLFPDEDIKTFGKKYGKAFEDADDILDALTNAQLIELIREHDYEIHPVYVYEHGGITISMGEFGTAPGYPFSDRFDAGMGGFVFVTKSDFCSKTGWGEDEWREKARIFLREEVETYDMFLRGQVYGLVVEESDSRGEWSEKESCWGYFSKKWGDALVEEIASDFIGQTYPTAEEAATAA